MSKYRGKKAIRFVEGSLLAPDEFDVEEYILRATNVVQGLTDDGRQLDEFGIEFSGYDEETIRRTESNLNRVLRSFEAE